MAWAILDSGVYIDHWERGLHEEALAAVARTFVVRHSAVVLSELRRGARTRKAQRNPAKRRDFQNDALIALTARRHGATVVTTNREDFGVLAGRLPISILPV